MRNYILIIYVFLILSGCTNSTSDDVGWFQKKSEAIEYGLKQENIKSDDIVGEININGDIFVVFKHGKTDKFTVGVSNVAQKDHKYKWIRSSSLVEISDKVSVNFFTESNSGNEYEFYIGLSQGRGAKINTNEGEIFPIIDPNTNIYYYIIFKK